MNTIAKGIVLRYILLLGAILTVAGLALLIRPSALLAQGPVQPDVDVCYAVANVSQDTFYVINPQTGIPAVVNKIEVSARGPLPKDLNDPQGGREKSAPTDVEALTFAPSPPDPNDSSSNVELFAASQRNFGVIDLATAAFTPTGSSIAAGFGVANGKRLINVDGLAYDWNNDRMYAVHRERDLGDPDLFFMVNMATGEYVPNAFGPGKHYVEMAIGGLSDLDDIAFDPNHRVNDSAPRLYGTMNERGDGYPNGMASRAVLLVTIEPETGAMTKVGDIVTADGSPVFDVEGLTFDKDGNLYATSGWNYKPDLNFFYKIDKETGKVLEVGDLKPYRLYDTETIACPPPPPEVDDPRIMIKKYTNGKDADDPDGAEVPLIAPGDPVTWTYEVTNIGLVNIPVEDISVTDNIPGVNPLLVQPPPGTDPVLNPGEMWLYQATGIAIDLINPPVLAGLQLVDDVCSQGGSLTTTRTTAYTNIGKVVIPEDEDDDPSSYCPTPAITLEKSCNGVDADDPNQAPSVPEGAELRWEYVIKNTGGLDLVDIELTDDPSGTITCPFSGLAIGTSMTCTITRTATISDVPITANLGTVIGYGEGYDTIFDRDDMRVEASDPSHCRVEPTSTRGPADIELDSSMEFRWNYRVRNPNPDTPDRAVPLRNVVLDAGPGIATTPVVDPASADQILNPGETWTYSVTVPAQPMPSYPDLYTNLVTATAVTSTTVPPPVPVSDTCQPRPYVLSPALAVVATLNGSDASTKPGLKVGANDTLTWTYRVTNTLTVPVTGIEVKQIKVDTASTFLTVPCTSAALLTGQSTTCTLNGSAESDPVATVATVATVAGRVATPTTCEDPARTEIPVVENAVTYYNNLPVIDSQATTGAVRSRVFRDFFTATTPANGIQDPDETGIAGVLVTLVKTEETSVGMPLSDDGAGIYTISAVPPGTYYLLFKVPADHAMAEPGFTISNNTVNRQLDSDIAWALLVVETGIAIAGRTADFEVRAGEIVTGYDAGLVVPYVKPGTLYLPIIGH